MAVQLQSATQFELAKLRIIKILRDSSLSQYITPFSTYGAIAAINSSINSSSTPTYQLLNNPDPILSDLSAPHTPVIPSSLLYSPADLKSSSPTSPIGKLISLYNNDLGFFNIVTSKAFMLAYTNANSDGNNTVIAWDDYTNNKVYLYRDTVSGNTINGKWSTSYGQTTKLESLKYFTNYAAALQIYGEALAPTPHEYTYSTLPQYNSYVSFKCIVGEPDSTDVCSYSKWPSSNTRVFLLNVNVLSNNAISGTNAIGSSDANNLTYINSMVTSNTSFWNAFDANYPTLIEAVGGRDKFLPLYYRLNYDLAVTPILYAAMHDTIANISNYPYINDILNTPFVLNLINKGLIQISEANADYAITGNRLLKNTALQKWALNLPDVGTYDSYIVQRAIGGGGGVSNYIMPEIYSPWGFFATSNSFSTFTGFTPPNHFTSGGSNFAQTTGYSMATDNTLAELLRTYVIDFNQLFIINTTITGTGIYGNGTDGDTYTNFKNKFTTNPYALNLLQLGIPLSAFCYGNNNGNCDTSTSALDISYTIANPPVADEFGGTEFDCMLNQEMATLFNSSTATLWQNPNALASDIFTYLCSAQS
jgi:hypothetical protein